MATRQFSRSRPGRARLTGSNPSTQPPRQRRSAGVMTPNGTCPPDEGVRQLALIALRLRLVYGTALSAELALRQQAAEQDPEIADCLRGGVCDPIADQIGDLEDVIHRLRGGTPRAGA
jgi:hypothetical protein